MKKSELEQIIREEIESVLSEGPAMKLMKKVFGKAKKKKNVPHTPKIKGSKGNQKLPALSTAELEKMDRQYQAKYDELDRLLDDALERQDMGGYDPQLNDYIDDLNYQMNRISDYRQQIGYGLSTDLNSPVVRKVSGQIKKSRE